MAAIAITLVLFSKCIASPAPAQNKTNLTNVAQAGRESVKILNISKKYVSTTNNWVIAKKDIIFSVKKGDVIVVEFDKNDNILSISKANKSSVLIGKSFKLFNRSIDFIKSTKNFYVTTKGNWVLDKSLFKTHYKAGDMIEIIYLADDDIKAVKVIK